MKRFWANMNPTVRGFLVIGAIALAIVVLNLYNVLASLAILVRIAFLLAIAFFVFLVWRERREEIATWAVHAKLALYGAAILIAFDLLVFGFWGASGLGAVAFLLAITFFVFLVWRERREEISAWPMRAQIALYGAAILIVFDLLVFSFWGASGLGAVAFLLVLGICGYAGFRAWRSQHTYGY